mmetsp:Transcript_7641/g.22879  ORF Transcript_7641/g.22879 Transcript_7641/m.22879 type:complete len:248 (-) Transcript_7641:431-1174(-)
MVHHLVRGEFYRPSQKVARGDFPHRDVVQLVRRLLEDLELAVQLFVQLQNAGHVATPVAVVGRAPHRDQLLVEHPLVALHHQLVRPCDEVQAVDVVELLADVAAEEVPRPPRAQPPSYHLLRVRPKQVAHGALVGNLLLPVDQPDLVDRRNVRRETAVHPEHDAVHQGGQRQVVKHLNAVPPHVQRSVLAEALVIKSVDLRDLPRLVVPPYQEDPVRVPDLESQKEKKGLHGVKSSVHEVAHEQIIG